MYSSMKNRGTSIVIWFAIGLGVAACQGKSQTGLGNLSDASQGGSAGSLGTGGIGAGGAIGGGSAGGISTGGIGTGGIIGSGGSVDAGDAGGMCNGLPHPAGHPVCLPLATMVGCVSCEGQQHPGCAGVCVSDACWECGGSGWSLIQVDCAMNCSP